MIEVILGWVGLIIVVVLAWDGIMKRFGQSTITDGPTRQIEIVRKTYPANRDCCDGENEKTYPANRECCDDGTCGYCNQR